MEFKKLELEQNLSQERNLAEKVQCFDKLISELEKKKVPIGIVNSINQDIDDLNSFSGSSKDFSKQLRMIQSRILKMLEKDLKLVTKNHYRNMWLAFGMSGIGIPIGVALGLSVGNIGLLAIGLPIGMGIGIAVGTIKDRKAQETGKQLDLEPKY